MNELIKMVQERQEQLDRRIAQKEAEIEEIRAESEKLEIFLSLAKELFDKSDTPQEAASAPQEAASASQEAAPAEAPRIMPARQPRATGHGSPADV